MVEGEEGKDKIIKDEQIKKPSTVKVWIISIISMTVIVCGAILSYKIYYNHTHWITVIIEDGGRDVIPQPIVLKIHPGETIELPSVPEVEPTGCFFHCWDLYIKVDAKDHTYSDERLEINDTLYYYRHVGQMDENTKLYKDCCIEPYYDYHDPKAVYEKATME